MSETTDRDRERAAEIAQQCWWAGATGVPADHAVQHVAAALAAEREHALAPVLALADEYEDRAESVKSGSWHRTLWIVARRIRAATDPAR